MAKAKGELEKLTGRGFAPGMYSLGCMYDRGDEGAPNIPKAIEYWTKAEKAGHLIAKHRLAWYYRHECSGLKNKIRGYAKFLRVYFPYLYTQIRHPLSDRLRNW